MKRERGFAMLLVFAMAAAIALLMYKELPRVAFEAQRNREEMLIQRGEQYTRAIQLYVRKFKKYPAKMEDLEQTNQIRFLRKRYDDPMTGKSEWRLIHIGPGGVFTDSLTHKPPSKDKDDQKIANTFTYEAPATGSTLPQGQTDSAVPVARPSERAGLRLSGQTQQPGAIDPLNPQQPQPGYPPVGYVGGAPNQLTGNPMPPGIPGLPPGVNLQQQYNPQQQQGFNPQQPYGQPQPGFNPAAAVVNSQTGGVGSFPYSTQPGAQGAPPPFGQPGSTTSATGQPPGQNQALNLINQILTTPRQGGFAATAQPTGMQIGGGIAGVASTLERKGIKIYNEKQKYNEWEFLYDISKDTAGMGAALGNAPQTQPGATGQSQNQQTPGGSPFGGQSGFGNNQSTFGNSPSPFGNNNSGFGNQPPAAPQQQPQLPPQQIQPVGPP